MSVVEMVISVSGAVDLVSPVMTDHHRRVAYIASELAAELGRRQAEHRDIVIAAALHDTGALSLAERLECLEFETDSLRHSEMGYRLLKKFSPFANAALLVRHHHDRWDEGRWLGLGELGAPMDCHIIHLADRVAVLVDTSGDMASQAGNIRRKIREKSGEMFVPQFVEAFEEVAGREAFWENYTAAAQGVLQRSHEALALSAHELHEIAVLFSHLIDFRSRFTATHSAGVAECSAFLAGRMGFSLEEVRLMRIAGLLHDLGKLAVPTEIIEKPTGLLEHEFDAIKSHAYHTDRILREFRGLDTVRHWAALHHERLDGKGYPFGRKAEDIPLGSRILAVADVFTAITEDRPYRRGMPEDRAREVVSDMVGEMKLDPDVAAALARHYSEINAIRIEAQSAARKEYESIFLDL